MASLTTSTDGIVKTTSQGRFLATSPVAGEPSTGRIFSLDTKRDSKQKENSVAEQYRLTALSDDPLNQPGRRASITSRGSPGPSETSMRMTPQPATSSASSSVLPASISQSPWSSSAGPPDERQRPPSQREGRRLAITHPSITRRSLLTCIHKQKRLHTNPRFANDCRSRHRSETAQSGALFRRPAMANIAAFLLGKRVRTRPAFSVQSAYVSAESAAPYLRRTISVCEQRIYLSDLPGHHHAFLDHR